MSLHDTPMIVTVNALRLLMTVMWATNFYRLFAAARRTLRKSPEPNDVYRLLFWCISILMMSFGLRWFIFPGSMKVMVTPELVLWSMTYAFAALIGLAVSRAVRAHDA